MWGWGGAFEFYCRKCLPGFYNDVAGESCKQCARNTYSGEEGSVTCTPCDQDEISRSGSSVCSNIFEKGDQDGFCGLGQTSIVERPSNIFDVSYIQNVIVSLQFGDIKNIGDLTDEYKALLVGVNPSERQIYLLSNGEFVNRIDYECEVMTGVQFGPAGEIYVQLKNSENVLKGFIVMCKD